MLWGYANGIFPMAVSASDPVLHWFDPQQRGILPVGGVHVSRSMRRHLRRCTWHFTLNHDFVSVVEYCAEREETWINATLFSLYEELFELGHAHSLEIWEGDELIGGIFGLTIGGAFFGESMFSRRTNASKTALIIISEHLSACGFTLFDTQYPTEHLQSLGGKAISRAAYRRRLSRAIRISADIEARPLPDLQAVLQASTQTS
ncbi:leucyl/phenylalanyl-tRNA--protein transferase [Paracoccus sp. SCSIO 75233]|uniref:leucyl/phenylalanyl-tRNA--protein transferase n=1 Tax=Paracoccus sp. SCSIO 75233 TaxID=3017782 RepID=UPI0022F05A65|nr:leucyl/phenylalanyl-tRNA--protein transferase [Paracoccus sp. SCSIO 75233]WBU54818.1 leucyl/phenylalanyl-tRNA--protein transferase [Paracoccus sp. SCSIO 75233]